MAEALKRAFALLEVRATGEKNGKRTFSGIASSPTPDSYDDIVEPMGAEFATPMPLLWQHDSGDPIGWMTFAKPTAKGIPFEAEVADIPEDGELKKRLEKAWQYIKNKLVRGVSIGFKPIEWTRIENTGGYRYVKWQWLELSAVTIPANTDATITTIRAVALSSITAAGTRPSAPVAGIRAAPVAGRGSRTDEMKTLQQLLEERATKTARCTELKEARASAEGGKFTAEQATEFDGLMDDLDALEDEVRMARFGERMAASASVVSRGTAAEQRESRSGPTILVRKEDPADEFKGQAYTRYLIAKAVAWMGMQQGNFTSPVDVANHRWGKSHPKLVQNIKAAVAGGGTGSGEWGAELAQSDAKFQGDFVEFLYSATVFDQIALRPVPARTHIKGQDGAATGYWVGESKAIPFSKPDFSDVELLPLKVGAISGCSKELIRAPGSGAEMLIRDSIVKASAQRVDTTFVGQAAASAGVSPAGIGNGITALVPSGADAAAVRNDLMALYLPFLAAKNASGLVHIMTPSMAKAISLMVNSLGFKEFPELRATGGTLEGDPVYTGDNVAGGDWYLLKPSDIWKIDDSGVEVSMSDTATIEQNDAPQGAQDTPTAASATIMSAWQTESVFFKVVRSINYKLRRSGSVNLLQNGEYGGVAS